MNKIIKILLSIMMVSLSALFTISAGCKESIYHENIITQAFNVIQTEQSIQSYLCNIEETQKSKEIDLENIKNKMQQEIKAIKSIEDRQEWFLAYKDIIFKYAQWIDMPHTIFDVYTEEEITLMCRTVETECYGCEFMSKCNVASVILNRVVNGSEFGYSVTDVITKENQFAYHRENISQDTILSIMYVYEIGDTTDGCVAFRSDQRPDEWYGWKYMFTDNTGHNFYK